MIFFYSTCSDVMRFDWGPRGDTELLRGCVHEYIHLLYDRALQTTSQGQERIDVYIYIQSNCAVPTFIANILPLELLADIAKNVHVYCMVSDF